MGARYGLTFLWTALFTFPLMAAVQEIADRTALATGEGLGELARKRFRRTGTYVVGALLIVLIFANALNIAADLVAIGSGMNLLSAGPTWVWALVAGALITALLVQGTFAHIAVAFRVLAAGLVVYLVVMVIVTKNWSRVLDDALIPHWRMNREFVALLLAVLGTTISPYLFFWQSANRLEEMRDADEGGDRPAALKTRSRAGALLKEHTSRLDVFAGMAFSNVVMFCLIGVTAQTLHVHHVDTVTSAAAAARALTPFAGRFSSVIFALGFIGSGLLAVPVLAASGSVGLAGLLGKDWGFSRSVRRAPLFYSLVGLGTIGGTILSLWHVNPIRLLLLVAVMNGVIAAPLLVVVMMIATSRTLMGVHVNGRLANTLGWLTVFVMAGATVALFATGGASL